MDQVAKQSTIDRLKQATSVLVTVSNNPSVDQLAACIGLTLFLNKQRKHTTAVFSGNVPSTLEFLQPDKTIQKTTDSLQDFIISLDKSKADKLRYKVEDNVVRIYITPYKTAISEKDFNFAVGEINVDVVIALGVHSREQLDLAITSHGKILHDATIISINNIEGSNLGTINLQDKQSSSLCEMLVELAEIIQPDSFDPQMATAFLTGIVAETKRFSNEKTSARTMSLSAKLMAAGANQQLVATQLQYGGSSQIASGPTTHPQDEPGTLRIQHDTVEDIAPPAAPVPPSPSALPPPRPINLPNSPIGRVKNENYNSSFVSPGPQVKSSYLNSGPAGLNSGPAGGGTLTANTMPEQLSGSSDPLSNVQMGPTLSHDLGDQKLSTIENVVKGDNTLTEIEKTLGSPHVVNPMSANPVASADQIQSAKAAVDAAASAIPSPDPLAVINSNLPQPGVGAAPVQPTALPSAQKPLVPPDPGLPPEKTGVSLPPAPPPVPPPMMPPQPPMNSNS